MQVYKLIIRLSLRLSLPLNKTDISIYVDHYAGIEISNKTEPMIRLPLNKTDICIYADHHAAIETNNEAERMIKLTSE